MAISHIQINPALAHGAQVVNAVRAIKQGLDSLNDAFKTLELYKDGSVFTTAAVGDYGFADVAGAQACFDELNSLQGKLNVDTSVVAVNAAILQAFRKLA
jgi:hypothetical protein